ncbi:MAG: hypothetical protein TREMPRED_004261 [Tremellales sp. Tagirdzhanova-0007]|nr:MAG: hypothetical protein TREMPRED_004261 [Tremellales sp. Tagirdzhanova-0007]
MFSPDPQMFFESFLDEPYPQLVSSPIQSSFPQYDPISPYYNLGVTPMYKRIFPDPNSAPNWNAMELSALSELPSAGMDLSAFDAAMTYGSPFKALPPPMPMPMPSGPQRPASTSFLSYQSTLDSLPVFPSMHRSVSDPFIPTMASMPPMPSMASMPPMPSMASMPPMPSMVSMPPALATGGLFGTPTGRQAYPTVGKRLRPGPKPKPKTPRSGGFVDSSPAEEQGTLDPSIFAAPSSGSHIDEEVFDEADFEADEDLRAPSPKKALIFGPDLSSLSAAVQQQSSAPVQPQLVIQPARSAVPTDGERNAGLPRVFLEKMYSTFLSLDGTQSGQPVKRFKCLIEHCDRHFPRKSAIHSHIQTHLEDKPYTCDAEDW